MTENEKQAIVGEIAGNQKKMEAAPFAVTEEQLGQMIKEMEK